MLNAEQIEGNKTRFLQLLGEIDDVRVDTEGLARYLLNTDFFMAPASTKYNCAYDGGLVEHTLHVYDIMSDLVDVMKAKVSRNELLTVSLLHDVCKIGAFEKYAKNVKKYVDENSVERTQYSKWDPNEKKYFNWVSETAYKVSDDPDCDSVGTPGLKAVLSLSLYIPFTNRAFREVLIAMLNQYDGTKEMDAQFKQMLSKHPLAMLLHAADSLASYIKDYEQDNREAA